MSSARRALNIRRKAPLMGEVQGQGCIGQAPGVADMLAAACFHALECRPEDPEREGRDRFLLSIGHHAIALHAALMEAGTLPEDEFGTCGMDAGRMPMSGMPCCTPGMEITGGGLARGPGIAVGMAPGLKRRGSPAVVHDPISDGEPDEGSTRETATSGARRRLDDLVRDGTDALVVSTGLMTMRALDAAVKLAADGVSAGVLHCPAIKPFDAATLLAEVRRADRLEPTAGNHTGVGGLGERVAGALLTNGLAPKFGMIGLPDAFLEAGALPTLHEMRGLTAGRVADRIRARLLSPRRGRTNPRRPTTSKNSREESAMALMQDKFVVAAGAASARGLGKATAASPASSASAIRGGSSPGQDAARRQKWSARRSDPARHSAIRSDAPPDGVAIAASRCCGRS